MSTSAGDSYKVQQSLAPQRERTPYAKKSIIYQNDTNSGNYTNSVQFDLSHFANTNSFLDLSSASLQIPVIVTASTPSADTGAISSLDNFIAWKNGAWHIINSISVTYDGKEVVQPNNWTNAFVNYKVMSTWSKDDLQNFGATSLFAPDSTSSWIYNDNDDGTSLIVNGNGICNNKAIPAVPAVTLTDKYTGDFRYGNTGLWQRMRMINAKPDEEQASGATCGTVQNLKSLRNTDNFKNELKNYTKSFNSPSTTGTFFQQWYILCNIRLKDLSSFFENMPLVKGAYLKMNITLNTGYVTVRTPIVNGAGAVANAPGLYVNSSDINFQYTCPVMFNERTAAATNMPNASYLVSVGIVKPPPTSVSGFLSHSALAGENFNFSSCRISLPVIDMKAQDALTYIEETVNKRVEWTDLFSTQILNIAPGGTFNQMITNGTADAVGVLIVPFISASQHGNISKKFATSLANSSFSPALSPFATEPATPSPLSVTELQVLHGGENVLSPFISYSYEEFLYQLNDMPGRLNGNQSTSLCSGLFSAEDFEDNLRYYWISLNRNKEEDSVPKSITVIGKNNSQVAADYLVFIVNKKSININCSTGKVIQ